VSGSEEKTEEFYIKARMREDDNAHVCQDINILTVSLITSVCMTSKLHNMYHPSNNQIQRGDM